MVEVNLLPWREHQAHYEQHVLKAMIALAFLLAFIILIVLHLFVVNQQQQAQENNLRLQQELHRYLTVTRLSRQLTEPDKIAKMYAYRESTRKILYAFGEHPDASVCLTHMSRSKNHLILRGYAHSAVELANYLKTWQVMPLFSALKIASLEQLVHRRVVRFSLQMINQQLMQEEHRQ